MAQELTTINVSLPVHMCAYIEQRVKADGYGSISDLIRALVRDDQVRRAQQELERRLLAALDGGEATPMTAADWDDIKNAVKTKVAAREKESMILKRRQASLSLIEQAYWISEESPETADRFIDAAAASFSFLENNPEIGREYEARNVRLAGVRVWRVSGFEKHLIFYRPNPEGVEILDVIHAHATSRRSCSVCSGRRSEKASTVAPPSGLIWRP